MTTDVTIIGLGQMGSTLAGLLLDGGRSVTVWNRSAGKDTELLASGARTAIDPVAALAASPIVVICLSDYHAANAVLRAAGAREALHGRLIINLGTGGPDEVLNAAAWLQETGAKYIDGAIQAAPSQMGQADTPILVSGADDVFAESEPVLRFFGGNIVHLGARIDAAAYMDQATLSYVYGAFAGFLHGARIAEAVGINVAQLGNLVQAISPSFGAFFNHEAQVIQSGDFRVSESPMRISLPAVTRILDNSRELEINADLPALAHDWLVKADHAGLLDEELAALIKVLR